MKWMSSRIAHAAVAFAAATSSVMAGCQAPSSDDTSVSARSDGAGDNERGAIAEAASPVVLFPTWPIVPAPPVLLVPVAPNPVTLVPRVLQSDARLVAQFRPAVPRLRIENFGDTPVASINPLGPGATGLSGGVQHAPTVFLRGHANVFFVRNGVRDHIVSPVGTIVANMAPFPGEAVVIGNDLAGNVLEIIWPSLDPALPPTRPIHRIQLVNWTSDVTSGAVLEVVFDWQQYDPLSLKTLRQWNEPAFRVTVP
jgi:hypothetical protein